MPPPPGPPQTSTDSPEEILRTIAKAQGIDPDFAVSIGMIESSLNPNTKPSSAGAIGLMQLMPPTAARHQVNPHDPYENALGGVMELRQLHDQYKGNLEMMARRYNGRGPATTGYAQKVLGEYERRKGLPPGTLTSQISADDPGGGGPPPPPTAPIEGRREPGGVFGLGQNVPPDIAAQLDLIRAQKAGAAPPGRDILAENVTRGQGVAGGIVKRAADTAVTLGAGVHKIPGVTRAVDALYGEPGISTDSFGTAHELLKPISREEEVGAFGEQLAELFYSGRVISSAAKTLSAKAAPYLAPVVGRTLAKVIPKVAVEAAGGAAQTAAQGGDPVTGGEVSGAMSALGSTAGATGKWLRRTAAKKVEQALGASAQRYKAIARRLVPQILQRGITGSHESLINDAAAALDATDTKLDAVYQQSGGKLVSPQPVINALERSKDAFRTTAPHPQIPGMTQVIEIDERPIQQLQALQDKITEYGGSMTVNQLVAVRKVWDNIVSLVGGFEHRAGGAIGQPLAEQTEAWARREGAGAIRQLLATETPNLAALNKEWSFWKGLKDVVTQTAQRTAPQGPGLGSVVASGAGRVAGAAAAAGSGASPLNALGIGWAVGQGLKITKAIVTSPRWRLSSAQVRNQLAQALMEENPSALIRIAVQFGVIDQTHEPVNVALPPPPPETGGRGAPPPPPPRR